MGKRKYRKTGIITNPVPVIVSTDTGLIAAYVAKRSDLEGKGPHDLVPVVRSQGRILGNVQLLIPKHGVHDRYFRSQIHTDVIDALIARKRSLEKQAEDFRAELDAISQKMHKICTEHVQISNQYDALVSNKAVAMKRPRKKAKA